MNSFKDKNGLDWTPIFDGENLVQWLDERDIDLPDLIPSPGSRIPNIKAGSIIVALWYGCHYQAKARNINRTDFLKSFGIGEIMSSFEVILESIMASLPKSEVGAQAGPLGRGAKMTSSNSSPLPAEVT